jgi:Na+-driven multidrug efflux pump
VEGAALATIISQTASCIWIITFSVSRKAVIHLHIAAWKPKAAVIAQIMMFGSAQALLQFAMSAVQLLLNSSMGWYGAAGLGVANGGDVALSGMNIIGSIAMLILMPVFGINQGAQPVLGFNYGAKKFDRVLRAYLSAVVAATFICVVGFIIASLFPHALVRLFAPDGSEALLSFTPWAMRIFVTFLPLNGFQVVSTNMFVVTGRPKISIFLSMLRQVIVLIPCILLFGRLWGLRGVVYATPVADGFAIALTAVMISLELKKLRHPRPA